MTKDDNGTVKAISFMMIITLIGKILGLVRDQFLAGNFALGMEASAFLTASRIPRTFFDAIFASAISASFIPVFNEYLKKKGKEEAFKLSSNFITLVGVFTVGITILGMIFAPQLTNLFADGFDAETTALCTKLLRILFPSIIFTGIAFSFVGILQSMDEFNIPAAMSIVSNLIIIIYYIFFYKYFGIYGLTFAFLLGWTMQAVIQIPSLLKRGYRYKPIFSVNNEGIKKIFALMIPVMVSTWIQPINFAINTKFASRLLKGSGVPIIEYANSIYSIIVGVFVLSIVNVIFPKLSRLTIDNNNQEFSATLSATIESMMFLLIPMMAGLMCLSTPITSLIFERGAFGEYETSVTANALFYFSTGMVGFGIQNILSRAFYAQQKGKMPLISGVISILVNIFLCIALSPIMGVGGLALASSVSSIISALILLIPMQKEKKIVNRNIVIGIVKMAISAAFMSISVVVVRNQIQTGSGLVNTVLTIGASVIVGVIVYLVVCKFTKVKQMNLLFEYIKKSRKEG